MATGASKNSMDSGNSIKDQNKVTGIAKSANYYGQPKIPPKQPTTTGSPIVDKINNRHQQSSAQQQDSTNNPESMTEIDTISDRHSRSSGRSSGPDSLPWQNNQIGSQLSNDSGAESESVISIFSLLFNRKLGSYFISPNHRTLLYPIACSLNNHWIISTRNWSSVQPLLSVTRQCSYDPAQTICSSLSPTSRWDSHQHHL